MKWSNKWWAAGTILLMGLLGAAHAACVRTNALRTDDTSQAPIRFGAVNLSDTYLQPDGTLLASTVVPSSNYTAGGTTANTVLWICDIADKPTLQFLVAVNGRDRVGGYYLARKAGGMDYVYATWFKNVGLRMSMNGVVLSRNWGVVPVTSYQQVGGKIQIRLSDVPPLQAQLYKMSDDLPALDNPFNGCSGLGTQGIGIPVQNGTVYACWRPNAYIQLRGGGIASDSMGQDSFDNQQGVDNSNGFAYGMWNTSTLTSSATCRVNSSTSNVSFAPISVQELEQGSVRQGTFSVQLECSNAATSGTAQGQTSIGIQASGGAIAAAQQLGLTGSSGSVPFLVSDAYLTDSRLAKGVGISLTHSQTRKPLVFLGENITDPPGQNTNTGWYPVLEGASNSGASPTPGYTYHLQNYTATLSKIPGLTVTAGKVLATAYVQVRVQ